MATVRETGLIHVQGVQASGVRSGSAFFTPIKPKGGEGR
jgi:hypothetical protein